MTVLCELTLHCHITRPNAPRMQNADSTLQLMNFNNEQTNSISLMNRLPSFIQLWNWVCTRQRELVKLQMNWFLLLVPPRRIRT